MALLGQLRFARTADEARLPGDIAVERENVGVYFPITTSILISLVLSLLLWLFGR